MPKIMIEDLNGLKSYALRLAGRDGWEDLLHDTWIRAAESDAVPRNMGAWLNRVMWSVHMDNTRWKERGEVRYDQRAFSMDDVGEAGDQLAFRLGEKPTEREHRQLSQTEAEANFYERINNGEEKE